MEMLTAIVDSVASAFQRGGPVMYVILMVSIYTTALCIERWLHYRRHHRLLKFENNNMAAQLKEALASEKIMEGEADTPARRIAFQAFRHQSISKEELSDKIKACFLFETEKMEKNLNTISVSASLLPMLGLLGTVVGMVTAFDAIAQYGTGDPRMVADGISQALLTTEAGLISSIPLHFLHHNLSGKADNLIRRLDEYSSAILHIVTERG